MNDMKRWIYLTIDEYITEINNEKRKELNDLERTKQKQLKGIKQKMGKESNNIKVRILKNEEKQKRLEIEQIRLKKLL